MTDLDDAVKCSNNLAEVEPAKKRGSRARLGAAFASAIFPGLGQLLLGVVPRAVAYFVCLLGVALLYWPLRLPKTYVGFIFVGWLTFLPFVISAWDALRAKHPGLQIKSRSWLALFVPLAIFSSIVCVNLLFRASGFRNYSLPSSSMETTIEKGNLFVADLFAYRYSTPRPYEVIVFRKDNIPFVKRVIAGPGSTIEGKAGEVLVDGKRLSEPYVQHTGPPSPDLDNFGPTLVPAGKLFVIGDSRDVSYDSRTGAFGLIDVKDILGKPLYIYRSANGWRGRDIH